MDRVFDRVGRPERLLALGATSRITGILPAQTHRHSNLSAHPRRILADIQTYSTPCKSLSLDLVGPEDMVEEFFLPNRDFAIEPSVDPPSG